MSAKLREQLLKACLITFKEGRTIPILKENSSSQNNKAESTLRVRCPVPFCLENDDDDDDNSDDDDFSDDNDGAANNAGEESMPDDMTVAPNMNTFRVAVSGIAGAVGGAKTKAGRNCASG